jgi:hypothetical protein
MEGRIMNALAQEKPQVEEIEARPQPIMEILKPVEAKPEVAEERTPLTEEELSRRRDAVDFARVNCELEGLYCTDQTYIDLNERYARGEIGLDVIRKYLDGLIEARANEQQRQCA